MTGYQRTTGKILSKDNYREERWNPGKKEYEQSCLVAMRVEYTVNGKVYTHNFTGRDIRGNVGDDLELFYRESDPEKVRPAGTYRKNMRVKRAIRMLIIIAAAAALAFFLVLLAVCILVYPGSSAREILGHMADTVFGPSIVNVPDGYTDSEEHLKMIGIQDSTDFCIYRYSSCDPVETDPNYSMMDEGDCEMVRGYFADFRGWMETEDRLDQFDFDEGCISAGDYWLVYPGETQTEDGETSGQYDDYSVWFFDTQTMTLYFIHNDI